MCEKACINRFWLTSIHIHYKIKYGVMRNSVQFSSRNWRHRTSPNHRLNNRGSVLGRDIPISLDKPSPCFPSSSHAEIIDTFLDHPVLTDKIISFGSYLLEFIEAMQRYYCVYLNEDFIATLGPFPCRDLHFISILIMKYTAPP